MSRYPMIAAALTGMMLAGTSALKAQETPYDMRDMVGAHTPQADGEMARRGYARVGMENGGDRDWTYWWNAQNRSCLTIAIVRGRYDAITSTPSDDCRRQRGNSGYVDDRPNWERRNDSPGYGRPGQNGGRPGGIPLLNAKCPMGIDVHADQGGPIYINGNQARITTQQPNYYEARSGRTTVSISRNPDGSMSVSYTGPGRANGMCQIINY